MTDRFLFFAFSERKVELMLLMDEFAIDLGTANTLVYNKNKGLVYNEPSYIAQNCVDKRVIALGADAKHMLGRTNKNIVTSRPLLEGVISEYECVLPMIREILKSNHTLSARKKMTISVPNGVSEIEMRAIVDLGHQLGFKKLEIVDEPIVAALGEGIDINDAKGHMIVDIGAGTTDIAVISLGGIVVGKSLKIASDDFDTAIIKLLRDSYNLDIGKLTAENIKIDYTQKLLKDLTGSIEATGLNVVKGIPEKKAIPMDKITDCLAPIVELIIDELHEVLGNTEPELISDIIDTGIILTGGGSLIPLILKRMEATCDLPIVVSRNPLNSVGNGLQKKLDGYPVKEKYIRKTL
jgi:rod shape-determining protein MreB and related proteins